MFKATWNNIYGQSGQATFETQQEAQSWIDGHIASNTFGKPERWVMLERATDDDKSREVDRRLRDDIIGTEAEEILLPAEYTFTVTDITNEYDYLLEKCYKERKKEYGSLSDQLDEIYHDMESWKARISGIKAKYKKPTKA